VPFPINKLSKELSMSAFSKQIAQAKAIVREDAKRALARTKLLNNPAVKEAFEMIPLNLRSKAYISMSSFSNMVFISIHMDGLNSFKDKRFTNVLERFLDWKTTTSEYTHSDAPNKDVRFDKDFDDATMGRCTVSVTVMAYVKSDSPLCRIVTTGFKEEVVRTEIKQIVCA
jgi:hypothetical protein